MSINKADAIAKLERLADAQRARDCNAMGSAGWDAWNNRLKVLAETTDFRPMVEVLRLRGTSDE